MSFSSYAVGVANSSGPTTEPSMSAARRSLAQLWDYPDEPGSPILRAYALSARIRKGDAKAAEELLKLPDEASLALDAAMLHAIKERARHAME